MENEGAIFIALPNGFQILKIEKIISMGFCSFLASPFIHRDNASAKMTSVLKKKNFFSRPGHPLKITEFLHLPYIILLPPSSLVSPTPHLIPREDFSKPNIKKVKNKNNKGGHSLLNDGALLTF